MSGLEKKAEVPGPARHDWKQLAASGEFQRLLAKKKAFLAPAFAFFFACYFALPALIGFAPRLMSIRIWGSLTLAYLFALAQFVIGGMVAWLYIRAASRFDKFVAEFLQKQKKPEGEA